MRKGLFTAAIALLMLGGAAPLAQATMTWSPASHNFGSQESGVSSAPVTFTLTATCDAGPVACTMPALGIHTYGSVDAPGSDFNTDANACNAMTLLTPVFIGLGNTASCTVKVGFKPSSAGPKSGMLVTSDPLAPDAPLTGNGVNSDDKKNGSGSGKKCKKKKKGKKSAAAAKKKKKCKKKKKGK